MRQLTLHSLGIALLLLVGLSLAGETIAEAQVNLNARLQGEYAFTEARTCVNSSAGFGGSSGLELLPIPSGGFLSRSVASIRGITRFNGDGTGTSTGRSTNINLNVGPSGIPVSESTFTSDFTYSVGADGSVSGQGTSTFVIVAGSGQGNTGTVSGFQSRGRIVQANTSTLRGSADEPVVETVTQTTPAGVTTTFFRVCVRSGTTSKLGRSR